MRGIFGWHKPDPVKSCLLICSHSHGQMSIMNGIKGASHNTDLTHFLAASLLFFSFSGFNLYKTIFLPMT